MQSTVVPRGSPTSATVSLLLDIKPFLLICKIFALMPFSVDVTKLSLKRTRKDLFIYMTVTILHIISSGIVILSVLTTAPWQSLVHIVLFLCSFFYHIMTVVSIVQDALYSRSEFERVLQLISHCDGDLISGGVPVPVSYAKFVRLVLYFFLLLVFVNCIYVIKATENFYQILLSFLYVKNMAINFLILLRFAILQLLLNQRLGNINSCMSIWSTSKDKKGNRCVFCGLVTSHSNNCYANKISIKFSSSDVHYVRRAYEALCDLSTAITSIHEKFLMLFLTVAFLTTMIIICCAVLKDNTFHLQLNMTTVMCFTVSMQIVAVSLVLVPCHCVTSEARRTARLASLLLLRSSPGRRGVHQELKLLAHHTLSRKPTAVLFGAVTVDLRLFAVYFSVVVTYSTTLLSYR